MNVLPKLEEQYKVLIRAYLPNCEFNDGSYGQLKVLVTSYRDFYMRLILNCANRSPYFYYTYTRSRIKFSKDITLTERNIIKVLKKVK